MSQHQYLRSGNSQWTRSSRRTFTIIAISITRLTRDLRKVGRCHCSYYRRWSDGGTKIDGEAVMRPRSDRSCEEIVLLTRKNTIVFAALLPWVAKLWDGSTQYHKLNQLVQTSDACRALKTAILGSSARDRGVCDLCVLVRSGCLRFCFLVWWPDVGNEKLLWSWSSIGTRTLSKSKDDLSLVQ